MMLREPFFEPLDESTGNQGVIINTVQPYENFDKGCEVEMNQTDEGWSMKLWSLKARAMERWTNGGKRECSLLIIRIDVGYPRKYTGKCLEVDRLVIGWWHTPQCRKMSIIGLHHQPVVGRHMVLTTRLRRAPPITTNSQMVDNTGTLVTQKKREWEVGESKKCSQNVWERKEARKISCFPSLLNGWAHRPEKSVNARKTRRRNGRWVIIRISLTNPIPWSNHSELFYS